MSSGLIILECAVDFIEYGFCTHRGRDVWGKVPNSGFEAHDPLAAQMPPWWAEDDSDEAEQAYERAWQPHDEARDLAAARDLPERERKAVQELLAPATALWPHHQGSGSPLAYQNGRHRAHALMSAGVRSVPPSVTTAAAKPRIAPLDCATCLRAAPSGAHRGLRAVVSRMKESRRCANR